VAKGFGIAALVLAILSVFALYGFNFVTIWLAMICAAIAAMNGERPFTIASVIISFVGLVIFSPVTMAVVWGNLKGGHDQIALLAFSPFVLPIAALIVDVARKAESQVTQRVVIGVGVVIAVFLAFLVYDWEAEPTLTPEQAARSMLGLSTQPTEQAPSTAPAPAAINAPSTPANSACGFILDPIIYQRWQTEQRTRSIGCPIMVDSVASVSPKGTTGRWVRLGAGDGRGNILVMHSNGAYAGKVYVVEGCINMLYDQLGGSGSALGFPISDAYQAPGGSQQDFEGGKIYWSAATHQCNIVGQAPAAAPAATPATQTPQSPQQTVAALPTPCATVREDRAIVECDVSAGQEGFIKREGGQMATCIWPYPPNPIYDYVNLIVAEGEVPYNKPHSNTLTGIHFKVNHGARIKAQLLPWGQNCGAEPQ